MEVRLRVTDPRGRALAPRELVLRGGAVTIGRGHECEVCLDDPERVISSRHALLDLRDEGVWITDISRNGTFLNHSSEPLPPHQPVALHSGDRLTIGTYELLVSLGPTYSAAVAHLGVPEAGADLLPDLAPAGQTADILDLLGGGGHGEPPSPAPLGAGAHLIEDPFADAASLDSKLAAAPPPAEPSGTYQPTPVEQVYFRPPEPQAIPDDYDILSDAWLGPPAAPQVEPQVESQVAPVTPEASPWPAVEPALPDAKLGQTLASQESFEKPFEESFETDLVPPSPSAPSKPTPESVPPLTAAAPLTPRPARPPESLPRPGLRSPLPKAASTRDEPSDSALMAAFLQGLGIARDLPVEHPEVLMRDAGALLRELVAGLTLTLMGRAQFKSELRLGVTTIRPTENNPFKFAADPADLIDRLLFRPGHGFLPAVDAARAAFDDLRAHEMAMTAGLQAALRALLARFEPAELERHLTDRSRLDQILPMARKARYWDLFTAAYAEVAADATEDFMQLFGDAFARAYREQITRLEQARAPAAERVAD